MPLKRQPVHEKMVLLQSADSMHIYYWKKAQWLLDVDSENRLPTVEDVQRDYQELPISLPSNPKKSVKWNLESAFETMNLENNPMGDAQSQHWIRVWLQPEPHTSMSVGDVIKFKGRFYVVLPMGFSELSQKRPHMTRKFEGDGV